MSTAKTPNMASVDGVDTCEIEVYSLTNH